MNCRSAIEGYSSQFFKNFFFIKVKRNNVYKDINVRKYNNILKMTTQCSVLILILNPLTPLPIEVLFWRNYSLTNLFSDEQGRMLKSHLCVRGNKAQTSQLAMVYEISTKDRDRFAIQRKRQQFSVQELKKNLSILYTSLHKFDQLQS